MGDADDERGVDEQMLAFTEGLVALQAAVTQVTNTVGAFVAESNRRAARADADAATARAEAAAAGAAPAATGTPARSDLVRALQEVAHPTPKEVHGQTIRPFDFVYTDPSPGAHYALPSEPHHGVDQATIIKNESHLFKTIQRRRIDSREASPSYWVKEFENFISTPHKQAVIMYSSYEDYVRGTNMFYYGMQVWFSRLADGGTLAGWLDESSPLTLWNTFTKESVKVNRRAFDGHGGQLGFRAFLDDLKRRLNEGQVLEQPAQQHRTLRAHIDTHNAKTQSQRKLPVLQEFQDWGVQKERGDRYPENDPDRPSAIRFESGGYIQCNPAYDRNLVLSRSEFRALSLVIGEAFHRYCQKGVTSETGRTDDLLCAAAQKDLTRTQCPNYAWEMMKAYTDAYPESQEDLD